MDKESPSEAAQRLLKPPTTFRRERTRSYLYAPYSRKLHRRVYVYTHLGYDLWALLESDPNIRTYNERPPKIAIPLPDGQTAFFVAAAVSESKDGVIAIHIIDDKPQQDRTEDGGTESTEPALEWAKARSFSFIRWTPQTLHDNPVHLANLKHLLRYVSVPQIVVPPRLLERVKTVLMQRRKMTLISLIESMNDTDPEWVKRAVAESILERTCFSDIDTHPFSYATELSIHNGTGE